MEIVVDNLSKSYGDQKAVDGLSFSVSTGEVLGFLGPNGAGKTTTMKTIARFLDIESGDVRIDGKSLKSDGAGIQRHIGYLPENNPLYYDMPVMDYLGFCADLQELKGDYKQQRILEMIQICGLEEVKHKQINELSKGYRQRVGLAQAMVHDPAILILDEPTSGLDPNQIAEIRQLIKNLGQQKTVILSTHILPEVEATCDRIVIVNRGKIVADGTADSLKKRASGLTLFRVGVEGVAPQQLAVVLRQTDGVKQVDINPDNKQLDVHCDASHNFPELLFELCSQNRWYISQLVPVETSLEDIFRGLTL